MTFRYADSTIYAIYNSSGVVEGAGVIILMYFIQK